MNRILAYTVIAILLGSVTMVVPLALLGPDNLIPDDNHLETVPEAGKAPPERNNTLSTPEGLTEQPNGGAYDSQANESTQYETTLSETNLVSNLSSIGLITVPSFLVALGVFVYLKKRTM